MARNDLTLTSRLEGINTAIGFVTEYCNRLGFAARLKTIVLLVVEELVANTVHHGRAGSDSPITIALSEDTDDVIIDYRDEGVAFDPTIQVKAAVTHNHDVCGGYGWPLIRYYCHRIEYRREGKVNHCSLRIHHDM